MRIGKLIRWKGLIGMAFVVAFSFLVLSIVFSELKRNQDIRSRAGGSNIAKNFFCEGKEMCPDNHCVGETWRECLPCPPGKARSVFKVSCGENEYSECILDDTICNDK